MSTKIILIYVNTNYHKLHFPFTSVCHTRKRKILSSSLETSVSLLALVGYCLLLELELSINIIRKNSDVPSQAVLKHYYFSVNNSIIHNFMYLQADPTMRDKSL